MRKGTKLVTPGKTESYQERHTSHIKQTKHLEIWSNWYSVQKNIPI